MEPIIEVKNLSKEYTLSHRLPYETLRDKVANVVSRPFRKLRHNVKSNKEDFLALQNVNFTVEKGVAIGLIGPNGSGKSTLLKILSQITSPTTGEILLRGRVASLLEVGTGFHPELTGRENIYLNGAILGMSKKEIERKFNEIVDFSGVEQFLDTPVKRYSSGMIVRLAFSVAAHLEPDILIVDEVLAVGDAKFQKKSLGKMQEVSEQSGRTVIFVSHNMAAIRMLCTKGMYLKTGRTIGIQPLDEAIASYNSDAETPQNSALPVSNNGVTMHHFALQQNGQNTSEIDGDKPIDIRIEFSIAEAMTALRIGFFVKSVLGDTVIRSLFADWQEKENFTPGHYSVHAEVPPRQLTAGAYVVEPHISRYGIFDCGFGEMLRQTIQISMPTDFNPIHPGENSFGYMLIKPQWKVQKK